MVSSKEIDKRLEAKRKGITPKTVSEGDTRVGEKGQTCPSCETENPSTAKYCVGCGEKLAEKPLKPIQEAVKTDEIPPQESRITRRPDDFGRIGKPEVKSTKTPESSVNEHPEVDPVESIKKAKELLDIGAITQEEFDTIKKKYLDKI